MREIYDTKRTQVFIKSALYSWPSLMKIFFSVQIVDKSSNTKFRENPFIWGPSCCMRKDGRTDTVTELIVAFRNFREIA